MRAGIKIELFAFARYPILATDSRVSVGSRRPSEELNRGSLRWAPLPLRQSRSLIVINSAVNLNSRARTAAEGGEQRRQRCEM